MNANEEKPLDRGSTSKSAGIQEKIGQIFYSYGLFCSSYPYLVLTSAIIIAVLCSCPLINSPLPGSLPVGIWVNSPNDTGQLPEQPWCYMQQVVLRVAVIPWTDDLILTDAFRAPLYESFKLLDTVRNYQSEDSLQTLGQACLHIEAIKKAKDGQKNVLPEYSCLVLSPANFWQQDVQHFVQDPNIINTIFKHQTLQKGKTSIVDILFGMHLSDTGIKRYPLRNRRRILQYAVTLFLKEYDERFISGLRYKLQTLYPLHQNLNQSIESPQTTFNDTFIIQYPGDINFYEYVPLIVAYFLVMFYYYFSVRKIEIIKSKIGMAFTVILTVQTSLCMTFGMCFFFGLTLSSMAKQIFPYIVIIVGVENVLVLTKSVVSTPEHLDIKIRIAQGLSKEGWSITQNLLLEITILTIGIFTFIPFIQEFCIFGIVALVSDFFLQMFFFSTILGLDTRRMENSAEKSNFRSSLYQSGYDKPPLNVPVKGMIRSKSHPRLNSVHTNVVAGQTHAYEKKIPKRVRLVNIWARTRFFQRSFMFLMIAWISMILYNSGLMKHYFMDNLDSNNVKQNSNLTSPINLHPLFKSNDPAFTHILSEKLSAMYLRNNTEELEKLKHSEFAPWVKLSSQHWPSILGKYNITLSGKNIAVLPAISLSHAIPPEQAIMLRNPEEKTQQKFEWNSLAAALDPIDFSDLEGVSSLNNLPQSERPLYPTSPMEILLISILTVISVIVLAYIVAVLYKCVCSRNYAEWRASWTKEKTEEADVPVMLEAVPIVMKGHMQEIECLATDGCSIVSSCLGGQLKVWDSVTGELQATIDRNFYFNKQHSDGMVDDCEDNTMSDYESGSPPSRESSLLQLPSLKDKICINFSNASLSKSEKRGSSDVFDFGVQYRRLFSDQTENLRSRNRATMSWVSDQSDEYICDSAGSCENLNDDSEVASKKTKLSPIWCVDFLDNLIVIGCADGRLEFWEGTTGKFKYMFQDDSPFGGITSVKIVGSRVIAARLYGTIDLLQLQSYNQGRAIDWNFSCAYRRTHIRTGSTGSISDMKHIIQESSKEDMRCFKVLCAKAHQQPITCLDCEGGRILTGSQDHTLKVFRLEDGSPLYTLHGHCGPITCLFIDRVSPGTSGSGSQDGMLCVWDLLTGTCMYSIQAHDGSVTSLTYSASYVISLGTDERICVWERFQGHLLNTIHVQNTFTSQVQMLSPHLVVTARSSSLVIYDVRTGEIVRNIVLGRSPFVLVKYLLMLRDSVLCDYANQLRLVRFPIITRKFD